MKHAVLIVDGTRLCNLRCTYCNNWRTGPDQTMSFPVLARLTARVLNDSEHDVVAFNWHGGETTLLPIRFYEKALLLQARFRRPNQIVTNSIQTNGTRLTAEWARFLSSNNFTVGVSLDGPPEVHDRFRRDIAGGPTLAQTLRGIATLRENKVPFSVILVVDEGTLAVGANRVFDFFLEQSIFEYALNFAVPAAQPQAIPGSPCEHYVRPERVTQFLKQLYDRWLEYGDARISIREIDALRNGIAGRFTGVCTLTGGCFGALYRIEPNGDVGHCDYFAGDERYLWGNVLTHDFAAIRRGSRLLARKEENLYALTPLRSCPNFAVCSGWCPYERYVSLRHNVNHSQQCCGLSEVIDYMRAREANLGDKSLRDYRPGLGVEWAT
jgi:uncharacterized protein